MRPSCSRCSRLAIDCVNSGQQRYIFLETQTVIPARPRSSRAPDSPPMSTVSLTPSNELNLVTSSFLSALQVTDPRYDLSTYGDFLKDIPRRLGHHRVLDASTHALVSTFPVVRSRQMSTEGLKAYVESLNALRVCLNDPTQAHSAHILCAVYLLMICQVRPKQ